MSKKNWIVFTDGACSGNPGPGGWAFLAIDEQECCFEGGARDPQTTNNRMELQAAIEALRFLAARAELGHGSTVELHADSQYVLQGATEWIHGWRRRGWRTAAGKPVLNKEYWEELDRQHRILTERGVKVHWKKVLAHSGVPENERVDEIAVEFSQGRSPRLRQGEAA